jgi:uncharacterized membrane protein YeaQ/YmgE (transglycosylase-associated protein family)
MGWIVAIIGGFIAGIIAKAIVPGDEPGGFIMDAAIGIVGGIIGKLVLPFLGLPAASATSALWNLIVAVVGAIILLLIYHAIVGSSRRSTGTTV